jgi:hypothetical protein
VPQWHIAHLLPAVIRAHITRLGLIRCELRVGHHSHYSSLLLHEAVKLILTATSFPLQVYLLWSGVSRNLRPHQL